MRPVGSQNMNREQCIAMVRGYLDQGSFPYEVAPEGDRFRIAAGSSVVLVDFFNVGSSVGVWVHAPVIVDVKDGAPLERLAAMNTQVTFAKFSYHEDRRTIELENDLLGWTLDADELMHAVRAIADLADEWDEKLLPDFGGHVAVPPADPAAPADAIDV